jgi:NAD+ synthase (glutamine-hydrolysing)
MDYGFVRVCAATPDIQVADCNYNARQILTRIKEAQKQEAQLVVFPELCLTGYTSGDLFLQSLLLEETKRQLLWLKEQTKEDDIISVIGLPLAVEENLYNCAAVLQKGRILGIIPKSNIPNYSEFYELRHFAQPNKTIGTVKLGGEDIPFGTELLFCAKDMPDFKLAVEICEDLWIPNPPSISHALSGATVIANLSASNETVGKDAYREMLVESQSAKLFCAYVYADAGEGESTTDLVFAGQNFIYENGRILAKSKPFENQSIYADIDVERLANDRRRTNTFSNEAKVYQKIDVTLGKKAAPLNRSVSKTPFIPASEQERTKRCEQILEIQSMGLKKRISHSRAKTAVVGISGGLDSTLALLVTVRAFDKLAMPREDIVAVTMPCFGTTDRTYQNAVQFAKSLHVTLKEVDIKQAVLQHFSDIGHASDEYDVTYENAQARERTQVLMDIANQCGGLVIGTGDMSELALGWATYNGDHMSMYGVNASVPKTLIRYLVEYEANRTNNAILKQTLEDILDTPVSPELLPPEDGEISQKTEHIVGPYELHDFFLYYLVRFGFTPKKILYLAQKAFEGEYDREYILSWMKLFYRRFFTQQFKRSCIPDGPKVGTIALSPRGDWRMPSDASVRIWMDELDML